MLRKKFFNLIIIGFALILISSLGRQVWQLYRAGKNLETAQQKVENLKIENVNLGNQLKEVQSPEFIEKEAKNKLSYVKEGEVVVVLPKQESNQSIEEDKPKKKLANWQKWWQAVF